MSDVILENDHARLVYYPDRCIIHHTFLKQAEGDDFRTVLEMGLDFLAQHNLTKWLSDDARLTGLSRDDKHWAEDDWLPRASEAGWRYWALVVPSSVMARASYLPLVGPARNAGIEIMLLTSIDEGLEWLDSHD